LIILKKIYKKKRITQNQVYFKNQIDFRSHFQIEIFFEFSQETAKQQLSKKLNQYFVCVLGYFTDQYFESNFDVTTPNVFYVRFNIES